MISAMIKYVLWPLAALGVADLAYFLYILQKIRAAERDGRQIFWLKGNYRENVEALEKLIGCIDSAKRSICIAVAMVTHPRVVQAILNARKRCVSIRMIFDDSLKKANGSPVDDFECDQMAMKFTTETQYMANRFCLIDVRNGIFTNGLLIHSSMNWTENVFNKSFGNISIISNGNGNILKSYNDAFNYMWNSL